MGFLKRILKNFLLARIESIGNIAKTLPNSVNRPNLSDTKSNLYWGGWLLISSLTYFRRALFTYFLKFQSRWWFRIVLKLVTKLWAPFSAVMGLIRLFRVWRLIIISICGLFWLIFSPQDIWIICSFYAWQMFSNMDVFFFWFKEEIEDFIYWATRWKESNKGLIETLRNKIMPSEEAREKVFVNSPLETKTETAPDVKQDEVPFYKNPKWWAVNIALSLVVCGVMYYFYAYGGSSGNADTGSTGTIDKGKQTSLNPIETFYETYYSKKRRGIDSYNLAEGADAGTIELNRKTWAGPSTSKDTLNVLAIPQEQLDERARLLAEANRRIDEAANKVMPDRIPSPAISDKSAEALEAISKDPEIVNNPFSGVRSPRAGVVEAASSVAEESSRAASPVAEAASSVAEESSRAASPVAEAGGSTTGSTGSGGGDLSTFFQRVDESAQVVSTEAAEPQFNGEFNGEYYDGSGPFE